MELGLKNKVALITGASKGIGLASAEILASEGTNLILVARNLDRLKDISRKFKKIYNSTVICISSDLSLKNSADMIVEQALNEFERIDILINSAGASKAGVFEELMDEDWENALNLKFLGAVRMVRAILPIMKKQKYGKIINVAGNTGRQPHPNFLTGSAANAALLAFTKGISEHIIGDGIFINALQPGPTKTEHWDQLMEKLSRNSELDSEEFEKEFLKQIPMRRIAEPIEMAKTIIFLVSDASTFMTGRSVTVDGGWTKELA